jgi:hypothetical protein
MRKAITALEWGIGGALAVVAVVVWGQGAVLFASMVA